MTIVPQLSFWSDSWYCKKYLHVLTDSLLVNSHWSFGCSDRMDPLAERDCFGLKWFYLSLKELWSRSLIHQHINDVSMNSELNDLPSLLRELTASPAIVKSAGADEKRKRISLCSASDVQLKRVGSSDVSWNWHWRLDWNWRWKWYWRWYPAWLIMRIERYFRYG